MVKTLDKINKTELINLQRLAYLLKSLSPSELETLEILLDEEASKTLKLSLKELDEGRGISFEKW